MATALSSEITARLDELERNHRLQHHWMRQLHRRLDIEDPDLGAFVAEQLHSVLGRTSPVDTWEEAANPTALVLTLDTVVSGALNATTYEMVERVFIQPKLLPSLADFFELHRWENQEGLQQLHPMLRRFRTVPTIASMIEKTFDASVLSCVEFIRTIQRRFDSVGLGLLPDEMVSEALDRIFDMAARSKPTD